MHTKESDLSDRRVLWARALELNHLANGNSGLALFYRRMQREFLDAHNVLGDTNDQVDVLEKEAARALADTHR